MSDPRRLLDDPGSPEARLLASALDEPPPPDLLVRTVDAAAFAAGVPSAAAAAKAKAVGVVAAKGAGGGVLGAAGVGAVVGLLFVGAAGIASRRVEPPPTATAVVVAPLAPPRAVVAPAAPVESAVEKPTPPPVPASAAAAPPSRPALSARPSDLAAELALLDEAQGALRAGEPRRARTVLDRYVREVPHGQMAREAALLRAEVDAAIEAKAKDHTNP